MITSFLQNEFVIVIESFIHFSLAIISLENRCSVNAFKKLSQLFVAHFPKFQKVHILKMLRFALPYYTVEGSV